MISLNIFFRPWRMPLYIYSDVLLKENKTASWNSKNKLGPIFIAHSTDFLRYESFVAFGVWCHLPGAALNPIFGAMSKDMMDYNKSGCCSQCFFSNSVLSVLFHF